MLSPLLFIIVMEALSRRSEGFMTEDCLASCCMQMNLLADSEDDLKKKLQR